MLVLENLLLSLDTHCKERLKHKPLTKNSPIPSNRAVFLKCLFKMCLSCHSYHRLLNSLQVYTNFMLKLVMFCFAILDNTRESTISTGQLQL